MVSTQDGHLSFWDVDTVHGRIEFADKILYDTAQAGATHGDAQAVCLASKLTALSARNLLAGWAVLRAVPGHGLLLEPRQGGLLPLRLGRADEGASPPPQHLSAAACSDFLRALRA